MDFLSHDTGFWVLISFVVFAAFAYFAGKKSVLKGLDDRIEGIRQEIAQAENLRVEAQELLAQYQRKARDAEKEARDIMARAQASAEKIRAEAERELSETMARKEAQLEERIKRIEQNAAAEIRSHAADLAVSATTEIIMCTLDQKIDDTLKSQTVSSLRDKLN